MRYLAFTLVLLLVLLGSLTAADDVPKNAPPERIKWWRSLKFGMFIHWGPWSQMGRGGIFRGRNTKGERVWTAEQIASFLNLYRTFNPVKFDPRRWARIAREAGMRYVVFTTKHHDGFCNFDTALTDFRITSPECPYHTNPNADITRAIVEAFRAEGLAIGLYYSHPDQHHPDGVWWSRHWNYEPDFVKRFPDRWKRFIEFERGQVKELLTKYGKIDIFWFDISLPKEGWSDTVEMLKMMRRLQPDIIIDNRGTGEFADFSTPEQQVPETPPLGAWETSMTISEGGGYWYKGPNAKYKSSKKLIQILCEVVSKGGNYLLNVGPRPDGTIPPQEVERLKDMGKWLKANGEAIYGASASPFRYPADWGYVTRKGQRLYLIVCKPPKERTITLGLLNNISRATFLRTGKRVKFAKKPDGSGWEFELPARLPDEFASVIVVEFEGEPSVLNVPHFKANPDGSILLRPEDAEVFGYRLRYQPDRNNLGAWVDARDWAEWYFISSKAGRYTLEITYGCSSPDNTFAIVVDGQKIVCKTEHTGHIRTYKPFVVGNVWLPKGYVKLSVKPVGGIKGALMNFRAIRLIPEK